MREESRVLPDEARTLSDPLSEDSIRARVIRLAFGGDPQRFEEFVRVIAEATPAGVEVILRGSAVTGHKWMSDEPFDADGPGTSDLDVTFVGGSMITLFREFHIPEIHSVPLSEAHPFASPALGALRKDLWAFTGNRIAVRFQYECRDESGQWWRSYGNEQWEFDDEGYMRRREASINDVRIDESERRIFGPRPASERGQPLPLR